MLATAVCWNFSSSITLFFLKSDSYRQTLGIFSSKRSRTPLFDVVIVVSICGGLFLCVYILYAGISVGFNMVGFEVRFEFFGGLVVSRFGF